MLPKERVRNAFDTREVDRVPVCHVGFSSAVASMILGRDAWVGGGIQQFREARALWEGEEAHAEFLARSRRDAFDLAVATGQDIVRMEYWRMPVRPDRRIDERTFLYGDPDGDYKVYRFDADTELFSIIDQRPETRGIADYEALEAFIAREEAALAGFRPTDADFQETRRLIARYGGERTVRTDAGYIGLPYEAIWLEATMLRPDLVRRHLETQAERLVLSAPFLAAAGAQYLFGGGDFASTTGTFFSPHVFHELLLPPLKRMTDACHKHGLLYLFASDGRLWAVADDLFGAAGVDGYYEIDRRAGMDLETLRDRFPRLILLGNLSSQALHTGTRQEVADEVASCMDVARRRRGVMVGLSNYALPGTPEANLQTMLDEIERLR
ncbi:MAG: hypothetical protein GXY85_02390 [Candidatus Brocadiaceae bacterium]|nr:hypothetical protein [Candidatus Brocadiaceae bacterium]